jgi:Tol biopolymer transport system component
MNDSRLNTQPKEESEMIQKSFCLMIMFVCVIFLNDGFAQGNDAGQNLPGESFSLKEGDSAKVFLRKKEKASVSLGKIEGPVEIYYINIGDPNLSNFTQINGYQMFRAETGEILQIRYSVGTGNKILNNIAAVQYKAGTTPALSSPTKKPSKQNSSPSTAPTQRPYTVPERGYVPIPTLAQKPFNQGTWRFEELVSALERSQPQVLFQKPIQEGKKGLEGEKGVDHYAPKWSPDGKKLAFIAYYPGESRTHIKIRDFATTSTGLWTEVKPERDSYDMMFAWAPEGSDAAVFSRRRYPAAKSYDIYTYDFKATDGAPTKINQNREGMHKNPERHPKKDEFVYEHESQLYKYVSGRELRWIPGTQPAISPSGDKVAFVQQDGGGQGIFLIDWNARDQNRKVTVFYQEKKSASRPVWSPDGTKLAFYVRDITGQTRDIYCYQVNSLGSLGIENHPTAGKDVIFNKTFEGTTLAWGPDSQTLVFFKYSGAYQRLYLLDVTNPSAEKELDFDPTTTHTLGLDVSVHPAVSINPIYADIKKSHEIAFIASKDGVRGVYVMMLDHFGKR